MLFPVNPFPVGCKAERIARSHEKPQGQGCILSGNAGQRHGETSRRHGEETQQGRGGAGVLSLPGQGHGHTHRFCNG